MTINIDDLTENELLELNHRIVERLAQLSRVFAIDVCAYAVMSNHHHLVLKLNPQAGAAWSEEEVLERWCSLFSGPLLVQRLRAGEPERVNLFPTLRRFFLCNNLGQFDADRG